MELQRASLSGRHKGNGLLEQEKQRTLALQREELATFHKMQSQHRQEQQRWERERERHRQQVEATEARLQQREEECRRLEVISRKFTRCSLPEAARPQTSGCDFTRFGFG